MTRSLNSVLTPLETYDVQCDTLVIGAGACGLVAALAAYEQNQTVLVVERDETPQGSTALSAGLIPAAGTKFQHEVGIEDSPEIFANDIQDKAKNENNQPIVDVLTQNSSRVIEWLADGHGLDFSVVTDFGYPGHSKRRMHGLPTRAGVELIDALRTACEAVGIDIICSRRAQLLFYDGYRISGAGVIGPEGRMETIECQKLILACNGFGGNRTLVSELMPEIKEGLWFGHDGNQGDAIYWAAGLDAKLKHLGAYQGHGNVAYPHGILITWAVITEGGIQVNSLGKRFWNEAQGYSEAARVVLSQPNGQAYAIFDGRIAGIARQFNDFKRAERSSAIKVSDTLGGLSNYLGLPAEALIETVDNIPWGSEDKFGRRFGDMQLSAPFYGVKVTGALFHTQGGLAINSSAQVLRNNGSPIENLYAGGGAACGVSGRKDSGYLSGNGLLTAVVLGKIAGEA